MPISYLMSGARGVGLTCAELQTLMGKKLTVARKCPLDSGKSEVGPGSYFKRVCSAL